jgi:hypothetical protein
MRRRPSSGVGFQSTSREPSAAPARAVILPNLSAKIAGSRRGRRCLPSRSGFAPRRRLPCRPALNRAQRNRWRARVRGLIILGVAGSWLASRLVLVVAGVGVAAGGVGAANPEAAAAPKSLVAGTQPSSPPRTPTEADFVGYPSCVLYLVSADTRLRVRAERAHDLCLWLAKRLSADGSLWSFRPRTAKRILSPICRMADPRAVFELDVTDDATRHRYGAQICTSLARAGWFDLSPSRDSSRSIGISVTPHRDRE